MAKRKYPAVKLGYAKFVSWFMDQLRARDSRGWVVTLRRLAKMVERDFEISITPQMIGSYLADAEKDSIIIRKPDRNNSSNKMALRYVLKD